MNTFAATMPAPRPAEALGVRGGAEAVEVPPDGAAEAFGAVLGALKEGRPAKETVRRADKPGDEAAPGASPSPAEPANPLLGLVTAVDAGTVPQLPATAMDPSALQALLARAVPGAAPAPAAAPPAAAAAGQVVSAQTASVPVASVPAGVAEIAAGIALAAGGNGQARSGLVQAAPIQDGSTPALPVQADAASRAFVETRPQVTILQQETHFAPVRPRLVAGQAATIPASAGQAGATPAPGAPAPVLPTLAAAVAEAMPAPEAASPLGAALGAGPPAASAPTGAAAPSAIAATPTQAAAPVPPAGSLPTPSPEASGKPRRAEATPAMAETATVASPTAQRLAGQAPPVEATTSIPGEGLTAEAGPREAITPVATAPGGALPSAATLGEPARQVAEAVAAELARPAATAAAATPGTEGPLRLLTIQLRPMDLGTVLVRMRLRDGQLEMSLHASREETAALLRQDGTLLTDLLRSSGYQPDSVTIGASGASQGDGGRPGSGAAFQSGAGGGQAQNGANPEQASRRQGEGAQDERSDPTSERIHETTSSSPDRSGLYL